ncbi:tyrosine-type recombinase/integrase [Clostridium sp. D53t1_180928_C8]|uniref:tyrosine-type recombinase/integrase n=1 Tax=Clostridium sp. D53t1_180928_C8 TaxID=2787101 RepID=UPI0018A9EE8F|nr:tyrosine-type recombinase/integrase [Clostridium sp. D53t1_180928_C8]
MQGSIRKKGSSYYIRYYDKNGKQIERVGGKTKKEAQLKLNEILYTLENGGPINSNMLLSAYLEMWLEDYIKDEKTHNTYDKYKNSINKYINPYLGDIQLNDLKVIHIEKFIKKIKTTKINYGNKQKTISPTTVQTYYGILRTALNKAVKLQMLNDNPCKFIDTPKRSKFKANILTPEEIKLVKQHLNISKYNDYIFNLALDLTLELGLRRGEMCGLTWDNINFENKTITLEKALIRIENEYVISDLKTDSSYDTLPISNSLCEKLKAHKNIQKLNKLKYGFTYTNTNIFNNINYELIFTWENGEYIAPSRFLQRLKRLMKQCEIEKNIRWHDLRHTNATLLLEGGVSIKTVQERLRHSLIQTTMDTYAHVTDKMNREATDKITNILNL